MTSKGSGGVGGSSTGGSGSGGGSASTSERVGGAAGGGSINNSIVSTIGLMSRGSHKRTNAVRAEEGRRAPDTLNLDEFLAEANAAEIRRITSRKNN